MGLKGPGFCQRSSKGGVADVGGTSDLGQLGVRGPGTHRYGWLVLLVLLLFIISVIIIIISIYFFIFIIYYC